MSRFPRFLAVAAGALVVAGGAVAGDLTLHPSGFGQQSYAAWKAQQGQPDFTASGDQSLYFQKMVPTATVAAGVAVFKGVSGLPASALGSLGFDYRTDGHCGAGAPRFNVVIQPPTGPKETYFIGCIYMADTGTTTYCPKNAPTACVWIRKRFPGPGAVAYGPSGPVSSLPTTGTISSLAINFDEGNDQGQGYVHLDNILVQLNGVPHCWTSASDNSASGDQDCPPPDVVLPPSLLPAGPLDLLADPLADAEITTALGDIAPNVPLASWTFFQTPLL